MGISRCWKKDKEFPPTLLLHPAGGTGVTERYSYQRKGIVPVLCLLSDPLPYLDGVKWWGNKGVPGMVLHLCVP